MNNLRVSYIWDEQLITQCDRLPAVRGRASMVHDLITAYNLLKHMQVVRSVSASYKDLKEFHSELYLDHLKSFNIVDDEYMTDNLDEDYGIGYDCPPVSDMFELVSTIAGSSITAAKCLLLDVADVVINWCGGWHHAHRFGAEGFCYVNDIVLAIENLRIKFPKVLYIDLDVHHGNGVQDAYSLSKTVFTLSFHKYEPGFYPGTGHIDDIGTLNGKGYTCNIPLHAAYTDDTLKYLFEKVFNEVYSRFAPDAVVLQCGADALSHDPHGGACLTIEGYCFCVRTVLDKRKPTILLGGGGYKHPNVARLWASITGLVTGVSLDENIPEHDHWPQYGPDYTLAINPTLARDNNKKSYLDNCIAAVEGNLEKYLHITENEETVPKMNKSVLDETKEKINEVKQNKTKVMLNKKTEYNTDKIKLLTKNNETSKEKQDVSADIYVFND